MTIVGASSEHAAALGRRLTDEAIWDHAVRNNLTIVTKDADFFAMLSLKSSPPKVVWVRTGNLRRSELLALLVQFWPRVLSLLETANLVEVHQDRLEAIKF